MDYDSLFWKRFGMYFHLCEMLSYLEDSVLKCILLVTD
jgi:hypothetical protein